MSRALDLLVAGGSRGKRSGSDLQSAWSVFFAFSSRIVANLDRLIRWGENARGLDDEWGATVLDARLERERIAQLQSFLRPTRPKKKR